MSNPEIIVVALLVSGIVAACDVAREPTPIEVTVGTWDEASMRFTELTPGQNVPIVLGFQGLVFVNLALRIPADLPSRFSAEGTIQLDRGGEATPYFDNQILFLSVDEAWQVVPSLRIPFGAPLFELDGRRAELDLMLYDTEDHVGHAEANFRIVDADCTHQPSGEFVCN